MIILVLWASISEVEGNVLEEKKTGAATTAAAKRDAKSIDWICGGLAG